MKRERERERDRERQRDHSMLEIPRDPFVYINSYKYCDDE
jgi:hypothetical protein